MGEHRGSSNQGLPPAVTTIVVLGLLALLGWNIVVVGPEGYPTSVILGGLLGAYAGIDRLVARNRGKDDQGGG